MILIFLKFSRTLRSCILLWPWQKIDTVITGIRHYDMSFFACVHFLHTCIPQCKFFLLVRVCLNHQLIFNFNQKVKHPSSAALLITSVNKFWHHFLPPLPSSQQLQAATTKGRRDSISFPIYTTDLNLIDFICFSLNWYIIDGTLDILAPWHTLRVSLPPLPSLQHQQAATVKGRSVKLNPLKDKCKQACHMMNTFHLIGATVYLLRKKIMTSSYLMHLHPLTL